MEYHSGGSLPLLGRPRYCPGATANGGYLCETGHCCGETGCCTYYYELWWFWLLWTVLILFSCCCAYRHRRAKLRVQQQQRQREISLLAYHGASSFPSSMMDLSFLASLKLPSYEEVAAHPSTPPPPYSSVFTTHRYPQPPRTVDPHLLTQHGPLLHRPLSDAPSSLSSDNSSSCSCDSCCPSSPCSSSLSAPVTYETDTSHASTPSEAPPLDITVETMASCLEVDETARAVAMAPADVSEADAAVEREPVATDQAVTVAIVTMATSTQPPASPAPEVDLAQCPTTVCTCRSGVVDSTPTSPAESPSDTPEASEIQTTTPPSPDPGRTLALISDSTGPSNPDPNLVQSPAPDPVPTNTVQSSGTLATNPSACPDLNQAPSKLSPDSVPVQSSLSSPGAGPRLDPGPGPCLILSQCSESDVVGPAPFCPAINIESGSSPPAPPLLLDPLTALHLAERGHASSLSPSPRATQSPPKQTLFSPCVDVFEPGPPNWEDGDEERDEEHHHYEEDDMEADESQYRHRRLTGDSGIEVCRCRVEEEDDEEEEEEEEERKQDSRRGGEGGEAEGDTHLHDSMDCPARVQITTGEELTLCSPASIPTPPSEDGGEVVIVVETV